MTQPAIPLHDLPPRPGDAGLHLGRRLRSMLRAPFREAYLDRLAPITRTERPDLERQAARWLAELPEHVQEEIDGMARGARTTASSVAEFLYADIARPSGPGVGPVRTDSAGASSRAEADLAGPLCSAAAGRSPDGRGAWVARNCDWLRAILVRGTAAVVHRRPHAIPILAVGIRGDIDVDTGVNAERLWLHLHTLPALDAPTDDRRRFSWLFWAREALETCASLDDLERFIERTRRDRGVIVVAVEGRTDEAAVFECGRGTHRRHEPGVGGRGWLTATNHPLDKVVTPQRARAARPGATTARRCALEASLAASPPDRLPDDLIDLLGRDDVEMRTPPHLRTIYSAVACPRERAIWFAAGTDAGRPAASTGRWGRVPIPF